MASMNDDYRPHPELIAARKIYAGMVDPDAPLAGMDDAAWRTIQAKTLFAIAESLDRLADALTMKGAS